MKRVGMGSRYQNTPLFNQLCEMADTHFKFDIPLKKVMLEGLIESLSTTKYTQAAIIVDGYTIFEENRQNFEGKCAYLGLSIGECLSLTCSGMCTIEECLKMVAVRSQLMEEVS